MDTPTPFLTFPPGSVPGTPILRGRHLRYGLLVALATAARPLGVADLERRIHELGFTIPPAPGSRSPTRSGGSVGGAEWFAAAAIAMSRE
jgi:hypothetical protein